MSNKLKELADRHGIKFYKDAADLKAKVEAKKAAEEKELAEAIEAEEKEKAAKAAPLKPVSPTPAAPVVVPTSKEPPAPVQVFVQAPQLPSQSDWLTVANKVWNTLLTLVAGAAIYAATDKLMASTNFVVGGM